MKLDVKALTLASAATGMLVYLMGAIVDRISAWGGAALLSYIFRLDVIELTQPLTLGSFIVGIVSFGILFALIGFSVAKAYNLLAWRSHSVSAPVTSGQFAGHTR